MFEGMVNYRRYVMRTTQRDDINVLQKAKSK